MTEGFKTRTVLPGDDVTDIVMKSPTPSSSSSSKKDKKHSPKIGPGLTIETTNLLLQNSDNHDKETATKTIIRVTRGGSLTHRPHSNTYAVLSNSKRYIPSVNDRVLGIVEERFGGEFYKVNIFGPHTALLPMISFEGATKRNKPNLSAGCLVYCRVVSCHRDMDPVLSCKVGSGNGDDGGSSRKDWMTEEGTYGEIKGGCSIRISLGLSRELIHPRNIVLNALGKTLPFEVAIGVNGVLWVHSNEPSHTILIMNAVKNSEVMTPEQTRGMVKALLKTVDVD
mmetsp:Transcript_48475/g.71858  ORF Transcript_48475/g.71858 Transcript_48475/m.71858 type:complete len:282 (+) Transcript_48475:153-998(+)|eukprot:CAMPEP_0195509876 /NCGR_PEP_ID=MMETSP0794_2-20130614/2686_1 /TAXON_ID=515487 /ORGANISM="Stephanopyxis turris, Strain CCMP 815" /LENGTH=281 /DNA_ID=CAMNT_0040637191 /DNA_START=153 /DNA_END=998 /DNA_ORIENTATION=+